MSDAAPSEILTSDIVVSAPGATLQVVKSGHDLTEQGLHRFQLLQVVRRNRGSGFGDQHASWRGGGYFSGLVQDNLFYSH